MARERRRHRRLWPEPVQELLLQAAFLDEDRAARAWHQAVGVLDFPEMDGDSIWLLALAHRRAPRSDELSTRIAGLGRRTWYANQLLVEAVGRTVGALDDEGVSSLVLDELPTALTFYPDLAARAIWQGALVVPTSDRATSMHVLQRLGWTPEGRTTDAMLAPARWVHLVEPTGHRLAVLFAGRTAGSRAGPQQGHERSRPLALGSVEARALGHAPQLVRLCVDGLRWKGRPSAAWAADATALVRGSPALDWTVVVHEASRHNVVRPVRMALGYLATTLEVAVPADVLTRLDHPGHRVREAVALRATRHAPDRFREPSLAMAAYLRQRTSHDNRHPRFMSFLASWWELDDTRHVPRRALRALGRVLGRRAVNHTGPPTPDRALTPR